MIDPDTTNLLLQGGGIVLAFEALQVVKKVVGNVKYKRIADNGGNPGRRSDDSRSGNGGSSSKIAVLETRMEHNSASLGRAFSAIEKNQEAIQENQGLLNEQGKVLAVIAAKLED